MWALSTSDVVPKLHHVREQVHGCRLYVAVDLKEGVLMTLVNFPLLPNLI